MNGIFNSILRIAQSQGIRPDSNSGALFYDEQDAMRKQRHNFVSGIQLASSVFRSISKLIGHE